MTHQLSDIAEIFVGIAVKGRIQSEPEGAVRVLQTGDVDERLQIDWERVASMDVTANRSSAWLREGDLIFAARTSPHYALVLDDPPQPALCASNLTVIRVDAQKATPHYVAAYINYGPGRDFLTTAAEGARVNYVSKAVLARMPIALPGLEEQTRASQVVALIEEEQRVLEALRRNRECTLRAYLADTQASAQESHGAGG